MNMSQNQRLLELYERLMSGEHIKKSVEAQHYQVSPKTIQRDIEDLRTMFAANGHVELPYNKKTNSYALSSYNRAINGSIAYALFKILFDSRAYTQEELHTIKDVLLNVTVVHDRKKVEALAKNELIHYTPVKKRSPLSLIESVWQLANASSHSQYVDIYYLKEHDKTASYRRIKPLGVMFSEYYFYIIAYDATKDDKFPITFRIDRIIDFTVLQTKFSQPHSSRFEEGMFRKRVQFMHTGELIHLKFKFTGRSPQAVLDRLPTAKLTKKDDHFIVTAEVFGRGIQMWLLSQAQYVEVLEPRSLRDEMKATIEHMLACYQ